MNHAKQHRDLKLTTGGVLLVCSVCALVYFVWSMFDGRSLIESVVCGILGLFGAAWYLLAMWASSQNDPDDPNEPARWVP